jgi:hypothetical protein
MSRRSPKSGGKHPKDLRVISSGSVEVLPPAAKIDLRDPYAVRRELAAVYRDARSGRIDSAVATRLGYLLSQLLRAFETTELQERLETLERILTQRRQDHDQGSNR